MNLNWNKNKKKIQDPSLPIPLTSSLATFEDGWAPAMRACKGSVLPFLSLDMDALRWGVPNCVPFRTRHSRQFRTAHVHTEACGNILVELNVISIGLLEWA